MKKFLAVSLLFLFGCAGTVPKTITYDNLNKIRNISCISLIGEDIELKGVGTTVFNNTSGQHHVDWKIDKYLEDLVLKEINKNNRMKYIDIDYSYDEFKKIYNFTKTTAMDFDKFDTAGIQSELSSLAKKYDLDSIIIIIRASHETTNTNQYVTGCSLFKHSFLGVNVSTNIYFSGNISLIDLSTMNKVAALPLWTYSELEGNIWKDDFNSYSKNELSYVESKLKEKLNELLPMMFRKMGISN